MRLFGVLIIYTIGTLASFHQFYWAASLYVWNNLFQPLAFAYNFKYFSSAQYVFIILIFSYLYCYLQGKISPSANRMIYVSLVYLIWLAICSIFSPLQQYVWDRFIEIIKYMLPILLIISGINKINHLKLFTISVVMSVSLWAAQAGVKGLISGVTRNMAIPYGQMSDNNDFMAATLGCIPITLYFSIHYIGKFEKYFKFLMILVSGLSLFAVIFSDSRGAGVSLFLIILIYFLLFSKNKIKYIIYLPLFMVVTYSLIPAEFINRMSSIEFSLANQTESSAQNRLFMMKAALNCAIDNPVFGVGPDSWIYISEEYSGQDTEPHSAYIKLAAETGFIGLFIYLYLLLSTLYKLKKFEKNRNIIDFSTDSNINFAIALFMSISGVSIAFMFLNHPYSEFLWLLLGIANSFLFLATSIDPVAKMDVVKSK